MNGYIKIHRKITEWEWYSEVNTKVVFLHLLLTANFKNKNWRGGIIKRGQVVTNRRKIASEVGLTEQQVRTALKKLQSTQDVTQDSTQGFSLYEVINYEEYQDEQPKNQPGDQPTDQPILKKLRNKESNNNIITEETKVSETSVSLVATKIGKANKSNPEINMLIETLKSKARQLGIAYDKTKERIFAKHILTAKHFQEFCSDVGMTNIEFAMNVMVASEKGKYFKGARAGPMQIYQDYAEVYNQTRQQHKKTEIIDIT